MRQTTRKIPTAALRFASLPAAIAAATGDSKARTFAGVAYSGDVIPNHLYWGNVIFDIATTKAAEKVPMLIEHDRAQRAGVGSITFGDDMKISGTLLDNAAGNAIANESDAGFPWQMSVHIEPGSVEQVQAGKTIKVNGRDVVGPASVFRNSTIRETSFTPTGADAHTSAQVFSAADGGFDVPVITFDEDQTAMTHEEQIAALTEQVTTLTAANAAAVERAEAAEGVIAGIKASARTEAIKTLFASIRRDYTEEAAAPFAGMDEAQFAATAAMLKDAIPVPNANLFSERATTGSATNANVNGAAVNPLDLTAIYAARKVARAA